MYLRKRRRKSSGIWTSLLLELFVGKLFAESVADTLLSVEVVATASPDFFASACLATGECVVDDGCGVESRVLHLGDGGIVVLLVLGVLDIVPGGRHG